ncbi:MAG: VanW family protein [Candidatus Andersenbacteria bacterium]
MKNKKVETTHWAASKWFVVLVVSLVTLGSGTGAAAWSLDVAEDPAMLPRMSVGGVDVSGKTREEATVLLQKAVDAFLAKPFVFTGTAESGEAKRFELSAQDLGLTINVAASVAAAYDLGHDQNKFKNVAAQVSVAFGGGHLPVVANFDRDTLDGMFETAFLTIEKPAKDARLSYANGKLTQLKPELGNEIIREPAYQTLQSNAQTLSHTDLQLSLGPTQPEVQPEQLAASQALAEQLLDSKLNFYYKEKNYSPTRDEIGGWLEFMSITPENVQGKASCACGLPEPKKKRGEEIVPDSATLPSLVVTPFDQKRRGDKATDPYIVLLPRENFTGLNRASAPELKRGKAMAVVGLNRDGLTHWLLAHPAAELDIEGQNARLAFEKGQVKVTQPSKAGTGVDLDAAVEDALFSIATDKPSVKLSLVEKKPAINEDVIDELGIKTLIARGISDSTNSSFNRIHNINRGFELLSGLVVAPGQEFSTIQAIAPIDGYNGYVPELVITGNKIRPEYGGGLCQVGTTLFRAALDAGFEITERQNHAFVVDHYLWPYGDWGVEATLYDDHPDLRFINDTEGYILIMAYLDEDYMAHVDIYGTDPGRTTQIDGPYRLSGSPAGGGTTSFTYTVTDDKTHKVVRQREFLSAFQPLSKFKLTR